MWRSVSRRRGPRRSRSSTPTRTRPENISPRTRSRPTTWSTWSLCLATSWPAISIRNSSRTFRPLRISARRSAWCPKRSTSPKSCRSFEGRMTILAPSAASGPTGAFDESRRTAPHVTIRGLTKHYPDAVIYDRFDFDIPRGKLISVFGPNGCGKSTLINMIAGLVPADAGEVLFDGRPLSKIRFGYVFQNYREALFPWLRAFDNIAYPLKLMGVPAPERNRRVERLIAHLGVKMDLALYPYYLSGGQQQLISIMRALIIEPEILCLDEPFSALDYEMTLFMRDQLQRVFMETKTTTVLVSHDLEEAVYLSDYVLLLSRHPARVVEFVPYDAPRPRTDKTLSEAGFIATKAHCLKLFQHEVRRG